MISSCRFSAIKVATLLIVSVVITAFPVSLSAESDFLLIDRDGDLLCDPPNDTSKFIAPDILYYSISPEADKKDSRSRHERVMAAIAEKTGKQVEWLQVSSSIEEIQMMRDGKLHIAGFSTGTTGFAVNLAGYIPVAVKARKDEMAGYHLQIIVNSKSPFHSLKDLAGKTIAHTSPTSNSGNIAPRALLPDFGLSADKTYNVVYSGKHKASILGVSDGTYPAAAVASSVLKRMISSGTVAGDDIRILYTSPKFPTLSMGYVYNLKPLLAEQIKAALLDYSLPAELAKTFKGITGYMEISYKKDWEIIRHIADYSGYTYTEAGLQKMLARKKK